MPFIIKLDPLHPDEPMLQQATAFLREGKTVAFPTETFYALGVCALLEPAIQKVYAIKGRDFDKPLPLIIHGESMLREVAAHIPECAPGLMRAFWPGPLTLIFKASGNIPPLLTAATGTVAVRDSSHPLARRLVKTAGIPITSTSANLSGDAGCSTADDVVRQFGDRIDLIIDGGPTPGGLPSSIVDLTVSPPRIVRQGAISTQRLTPFLGTRV
jgi:L-threonylcarbamoyladenylate synthase